MKMVIVIVLALLVTASFGFSQDNDKEVFEDYLTSFLNGDYDRAVEMQTEQMTKVFSIQSMKQSSDVIVKQYGKPESEYSTELIEQDGFKVYIILMKTTKGYIKFTVTVDENSKISGFFAAPVQDPRKSIPYVNKDSFTEQKVKFGVKEWKLDGVLTIPNNKDTYPLMIIVGGSGPTDMNGTVGPNTPYKDIAEGLATSGIGVLRYNKRAAQYSSKISSAIEEIENILDFEYVNDLLEAIDYASNIEGVNQILLAGHSLGGTIVPKIASNSKKIDGIVLLAPGVRRFAQISLDQNRYAKDYFGITDEQMKQVEQLFTMILNHELPENMSIQEGLTVGYYYEMDQYRPLDDLTSYKKPTLVIQGVEDFQATMKGDFLPLKEKYGERKNFSFIALNGINHLFMKSEEGVFHWTDEYNKPGFVDKRVIDAIVEWIGIHF